MNICRCLLAALFFFTTSAWAELAKVSGEEEAPVVEACVEPKGTIAIAEPQTLVLMALTQYSLPAPTGLLRQFIQSSNCFQVVERGIAMQNIQQERDLSSSGMLQSGSNMGGSQMVTADFVITPDVLFKDSNAGGAAVGAMVGSLFGGLGSVIGAVAGGVKLKEAQTTLVLADVRSSLQVAAATGTYKTTDWALGGILGVAGGGAYTSTDEGRLVAGALLDNYNTIVKTIKSDASLLAPTSAVAQKNASASLKATAFRPGDVLSPKLNGLKVYALPSRTSNVVGTINKADEVVFLGESAEGFLSIQGNELEGWVQDIMVR
jgi:curli biogenesis system outer membrane secretion channel CsgG